MPILLRVDFDALQVRAAAKVMKDGPQLRRLLALAAIYDGGTRNEAARIGVVIVTASRVGLLLSGRSRFRRASQFFLGTVFGGLALRLAFDSRR